MKANKLLSDIVSEENNLHPDPVDKRVGSRIRLRRRLLGYSQEKLALALGLSFQQVQKYEKGLNRVSASRLYYIAQILQVPISFFFDEILNQDEQGEDFFSLSFPEALTVEDISSTVNEVNVKDSQSKTIVCDVMDSKETADLLKAYYNIKDKEIRQKLLHLIKVMAE